MQKRDVIEYPKKYFYVLRPLFACEWINLFGTPPPIEFSKLVNSVVTDSNLKAEIDKLLSRKRNGEELAEEPAIPIINSYIESKISFFGNRTDYKKTHKVDINQLDRLFIETISSPIS